MSVDPNLLALGRVHERHAVNLYGKAVFGSGATSVQIIDLSYGGARVSLPLPYAAYGGPILSLRIDGILRASVEVKWSIGEKAGLAFRNLENHKKALHALFVEKGFERI